MNMVKDKKLLVGADFAGFPLKEAVVAHLKKKGWDITDVGVRSPQDEDTDLCSIASACGRFAHRRMGVREGADLLAAPVWASISRRANVPTYMQAWSSRYRRAARYHGQRRQCPGDGAFYVAPQMGIDIAEAYLNAELGTGYEWWHNFYEFHKLAIDELEAFDYEEYKANGFKVKHLGDYPLTLEDKPEGC